MTNSEPPEAEEKKEIQGGVNALLRQIAAPGPEFRGCPFWAWNAKLDPEELRRQIRHFKQMGFGGFFMHSRVGLNTSYLSEEWFDCIRACIDEAEKQGIKAWLYDEDRWPSGAAGGMVTKDPQYRQRQIVLTRQDEVSDRLPENVIGVFAAVVQNDHAERVRKFVPGEDALRQDETLLVFENREAPSSSWFNDQTYLDTMNPEAVAKFIETTHEAYRKNVRSKFGGSVPGIFTDEPNYFSGQADLRCMRPWTNALPEVFQKRYGYRIEEHLPELFFIVDEELFSRARLDFCDLATSLFVNSFSRLCGEWCEKNGLRFSGHVWAEDEPVFQTLHCGSAMRFYEFQQQPGIDLLTEHWGIFDSAKQCSSMAHQFGRKWRLSETYGCTGWDFPFMGHKALGDWQFALGINFRCQHLAWYSMNAEAKRDYPASLSYQSPWSPDFKNVEDYFARLGAALSEGEEQRDLLVIHPIESSWAVIVFTPGCEERNKQEARALYPLSNRLLAGNVDFDYGDEEILSRYGKAQNGALHVNLASYKAVLVPPLRTIRRTTLALLAEFRKAGGPVFYLGPAPRYVDGIPDDSAAKVFANFEPVSEDDLIEKLSPAARRVSIADEAGNEIAPALHLLRKAEDHQTLFLCNYGTEFGEQQSYPMVRDRKLEFPLVTVRIKAAPEEKVFELDLMTGALTAVASQNASGWTTFRTSLPRLGSRLFILCAKELASAPPVKTSALSGREILLPARDWRIETDDFNVLVLDHADYRVDGKPCGRDYILTIDDKLRTDFLQVRPRAGKMVQPWLSAHEPEPEKLLDLQLEYHFNCAEIPASECFLGIERPDLYAMELNGRELPQQDRGWWCDRSMRRIPIVPQLLQKGENVLTLRCRYHRYLPGLEMIYLLGNFGVSGETLIAPVRKLNVGDWCSQGLQNYAGNVIYHHTIALDSAPKTAKLCIGEWRGIGLGISVNGSPEKMIPWPPFELDVSNLLKPGANEIAIRIIGHRRNSHGPFYAANTWPAWTGPQQFKLYFGGPKRKLVPCGLLEPPVLKF